MTDATPGGMHHWEQFADVYGGPVVCKSFGAYDIICELSTNAITASSPRYRAHAIRGGGSPRTLESLGVRAADTACDPINRRRFGLATARDPDGRRRLGFAGSLDPGVSLVAPPKQPPQCLRCANPRLGRSGDIAGFGRRPGARGLERRRARGYLENVAAGGS